jgi:hypothetical protein
MNTKDLTNIGISAGVLMLVYHIMKGEGKRVIKNPSSPQDDADEQSFQYTLECIMSFDKNAVDSNLDNINMISSRFINNTVDTIEREERLIQEARDLAEKYKETFLQAKGAEASTRTYEKYLKYNNEINARKERILRLKKQLMVITNEMREITKKLTKKQ